MKRAFTIIGILFLVISGVAQNGSRFSTDLRFNEISINGSTTPELHSGDTLVFTISIENIGNEPYRDCMLSISANNPSIIFIDSTEYFDYIAPGNEYTLNRCLIAVIAPNIPDRNSILFTFSISNSTEEVLLQRSYRVSGINLTAESIHIFANGIAQRTFHPSECGSLAITLKNNSAQDLHYINIDILGSNDSNITVSGHTQIPVFQTGETFEYRPEYTTTAQFQSDNTVDIRIGYDVNGSNPQEITVSIVGHCNCEDFDGGQLPAGFYGEGTQAAWHIDSTTMAIGSHSIRSGQISHYDSSSVNLPVNVPHSTNVSFSYKVSSESNYDWLYFYIDDEQMGRWSGDHDWTQVSYNLSAGEHTLTWRYIKDKSVNTGSDCAWLDAICFPPYLYEAPSLTITPSPIEMSIVHNDTTGSSALITFSNPSDIYLLYENSITDSDGLPIGWLDISSENGSINAGEDKGITLQFCDLGLIPGDYSAILRTNVRDMDTTLITPIILHILSGVGIEEHPEPTCHVYPNPTNGEITIDNEYAIIKEISIYDIFGKLVLKEEANSYSHHIRISDYASGVYLMKIVTENNSVETLKIIKR